MMETLEELIAERGVPRYARSVNGEEFVSRRLLRGHGDQHKTSRTSSGTG